MGGRRDKAFSLHITRRPPLLVSDSSPLELSTIACAFIRPVILPLEIFILTNNHPFWRPHKTYLNK